MLTRVDVQSENPFYLNIKDARPTDSIIVEKIEGLDPPDIDLFLGEYARDGGHYSGRRVGKRNPLFLLTLNPNFAQGESVSGLRELLYRTFVDPRVSGDDVTIVLKDDEKEDRYLTGYTEKFEASIFSNDTTVQISMLCPNPYLLDVDESAAWGSGPNVIFNYLGSAETGVELELLVTVPTNVINIELNSQKVTQLDFNFQVDDRVLINTRRGERKIQVVRNGFIINILYALSTTSGWIELHKRNNELIIKGVDSSVVANVNTIAFRAAWWGV